MYQTENGKVSKIGIMQHREGEIKFEGRKEGGRVREKKNEEIQITQIISTIKSVYYIKAKGQTTTKTKPGQPNQIKQCQNKLGI